MQDLCERWGGQAVTMTPTPVLPRFAGEGSYLAGSRPSQPST
jgi:hypothetical protein